MFYRWCRLFFLSIKAFSVFKLLQNGSYATDLDGKIEQMQRNPYKTPLK